jgi:hypothetical protein
MKHYRTRAMAALAAGIMLSAAAVPAASARTAGPQSARPDTTVTSCASGSHWLKLTGSLGPTCYTGNGNIIVNRPGVDQEQIVGTHTVCLYIGSHQISCKTGPATIKITPPVQVSAVTIRTP